ncbi:hypothetical protein KUG02_07715 [Streptococcus equi subsp. zooepidemicus]|uniref:hypothetical protein n=1 Tax=Streptococcus equi TaxID=1336 RepID=UPI0013F675D5|nr:hypothetical protein [Streptococcus equi]MCD3433580.1 hypothetical protein [Streptococcus equi subsp. zooepidemicus]QTZ59054.1 hypothetical protein MCPGFBBE_01159 [Streptococcus equi subsp. zooepidemicus]QUF61766.1 hypothetical protein KCL43_06040 [Streptococcus equi subsp. zooepidemicus]QWN60466.1 hypothetical protein GJ622_05785 [Streptococcus equi subsp. zooepidemicus]HEL0793291.1 hypothetical protein [Streptococcus equi subsp. zooepidemicus]
MSAFKKNYINFGWLSDRAIYIDTITKEFYLTDIEKNSNGIMLLGPVMSSISYAFLQVIGTYIGIVDDFVFRVIILGLLMVLSMIFGAGIVLFVRSKANFTPYHLSDNHLAKVLKSANLQNWVIQICLIILSISSVCMSFLYLYRGKSATILMIGIFIAILTMLILDYSPLKKRRLIKKMKKSVLNGIH